MDGYSNTLCNFIALKTQKTAPTYKLEWLHSLDLILTTIMPLCEAYSLHIYLCVRFYVIAEQVSTLTFTNISWHPNITPICDFSTSHSKTISSTNVPPLSGFTLSTTRIWNVAAGVFFHSAATALVRSGADVGRWGMIHSRCWNSSQKCWIGVKGRGFV